MKKMLSSLSFLLAALFFVLSVNVSAQSTTDTVYIPGTSSLQISDIINADTSVTDYRVYVLDRGAIYYIEKAFELTSSCEFIATGAAERPPVLAPAIRADNSSEEWFFKLIESGISVDLSDLYLLSMRSDGQTLGWSRAISIQASHCSMKLRNVVFDGWTEAGIRVSSDFYTLDVQDCHFRNFIHSTSYFGGQPFMTDYNNPTNVSFINNTFFACNSYLFSIRGLGGHSEFIHNTVAYTAVNPLITRFPDDLTVKDNVFYGAHAWGGDPTQTIGGWFLNYPDTVNSSVYQMRLPINYNGYVPSGPSALDWPEEGIVFDSSTYTRVTTNNVFYIPDALNDFYTAWNDTVTVYDSVEVLSGPKQYLKRVINKPTFINGFVTAVLDSAMNPNSPWYSPNVVYANNMEVDPQFTDQGTLNHVNELIGYVYRIISSTLEDGWQYEMNFPPTWPVPEDLTYTNSNLISGGSDGYAIGDLNWFPSQKEQWLATSIEQVNNELPTQYELSQNYPNPFNPTTMINFSVSQNEKITLKVYNVLGQLVSTLVDSELAAGNYKVNFDASSLSSGMYFYTLQAGDYSVTKKMMLLK